ncbi:MAG: hypothetical protein ACLFWL_18145 [Candidatus Brocadiia bacterium]
MNKKPKPVRLITLIAVGILVVVAYYFLETLQQRGETSSGEGVRQGVKRLSSDYISLLTPGEVADAVGVQRVEVETFRAHTRPLARVRFKGSDGPKLLLQYEIERIGNPEEDYQKRHEVLEQRAGEMVFLEELGWKALRYTPAGDGQQELVFWDREKKLRVHLETGVATFEAVKALAVEMGNRLPE